MGPLLFLQVVSLIGFFMALVCKDRLGALTCAAAFVLAYYWAMNLS